MGTKTLLLTGLLLSVPGFLLVRNLFKGNQDPLEEFAKTIKSIEQFVDATIEEDCDAFTCPPGMTRTTNLQYVPVSNGCGSFGIEWKENALPQKELKQCCNIHDLCYDECGSDKDMCDLQFKRCLYRVCNSKKDQLTSIHMKMCKASAKIMYTGTLALGCKAFQDAQKSSCQCVPSEEL